MDDGGIHRKGWVGMGHGELLHQENKGVGIYIVGNGGNGKLG
jgi:hypothetical protein